jgi:hypothetical protein
MKIARIFRHDDGKFYVCDDNAPDLDARGEAFDTKADAMLAAKEFGFTHAKGSGTYQGNELTNLKYPYNFRKRNKVKREAAKWRLF